MATLPTTVTPPQDQSLPPVPSGPSQSRPRTIFELAQERGGAGGGGIIRGKPTFLQQAGEYLSDVTPEQAGRFGLEVGGSLAATAIAPQVAIPARIAKYALPAATKLLTQYPRTGAVAGRALAAGGGAGAGSLASEAFDPTTHPWLTAGKAGAAALGGQAVGEMGGAVAKKVLAPMRGKEEPGAIAAQSLLRSKGASLTPGQYTKSQVLDVVENVGEAGFLSRRLPAFRERSQQVAVDILEDFKAQFGAGFGREDAGVMVQNAVKTTADEWRKKGHLLYDKIDDLTKARPVPVDLQSIKKRTFQLAGQRALKDPTATALIRQIMNLPDTVSFGFAQRLRTDLLRAGSPDSAILKGQIEGMADVLAKGVDMAMEQAARQLNPDALKAWRAAGAFWKGTTSRPGVVLFDDPVIKQVMKAHPDAVLASLLKKDRATRIRYAKAVLPADVMDEIRRSFLEQAYEKASTGGTLSGTALTREIQGFGEVTKELFGVTHEGSLKTMARTLELTQSRGATQNWTLAVRSGQMGAAMLAVTGQVGGKGATIIMAPPVAAFFATNPATLRWLTKGFSTPAGTPEALGIMTRVIALARENNIPVQMAQPSPQGSFAGPQPTFPAPLRSPVPSLSSQPPLPTVSPPPAPIQK